VALINGNSNMHINKVSNVGFELVLRQVTAVLSFTELFVSTRLRSQTSSTWTADDRRRAAGLSQQQQQQQQHLYLTNYAGRLSPAIPP